ncbi:DgyrCDS5184 [Dimorphilus gyrociliatus]|uniref:DgyrCDS5184 n=1 Tax=Dimorphilus gyrociliatus TaxID=2664684 RepID=A0A7I8VNW4_9ANNE|nr:DgyrCDS5184 [Dimorphilus gyrociliatus]
MSSSLTDYNLKENLKQLRALLISDIVEASGKNIFFSISKQTAAIVENIFIVALEFSADFYRSFIEFQNAEILDLHSNVELWVEGENVIRKNIISFIQDIASVKFQANTLIIIDCFDPMSNCSTVLNQVLNKYILRQKEKIRPYIIGLCHRDVIEINDIQTIFPFHIKLRPPKCKTNQYECDIIKRKSSGKIEYTREGFNFTDKKITGSNILSNNLIESIKQDNTEAADPTKNLSFNLNLTEKEEEARRKLQLPYVRTNKSTPKDEGPKSDSGKGNIYYEPDEADDFDEEDPDDDLDRKEHRIAFRMNENFLYRIREESLTCRVCLETWINKSPILFPCQHITCESCTTGVMKNSKSIHSFKCPVCRKVVTKLDVKKFRFFRTLEHVGSKVTIDQASQTEWENNESEKTVDINEIRDYLIKQKKRKLNNLIYLGDLHSVRRKVIFISLDGFRYDYLEKVKDKRGYASTPNFNRIIEEGVYVKDGITNAFITKTFPNHWSLVTGRYEESHGLIGNEMFDPRRNQTFNLTADVTDSFWYNNGDGSGGEPIWVTNQRAGGASGVLYWVGDGVVINDHRPTRFEFFNFKYANGDKVPIDKLIRWFDTEDCPINLGLLYFRQPDAAGHKFGPDSNEVLDEIIKLDGYIGYLIKRLEEVDMYDEMNIIITSDHGMAESDSEKVIVLDDYLKVDYTSYMDSPIYSIDPIDGVSTVDEIVKSLSKVQNMKVYRKQDIPEHFHYRNNIRVRSIVLVADVGWNIVKTKEEKQKWKRRGSHGYNNSIKIMHPFFVARGPIFKKNYTASSFENVDIYPLICEIVDAKPYPNNGSLSRISHIIMKEKLFHVTTTFITYVASIAFAALFSSIFSLVACRVYRIQRRHKYNSSYHVSINGLPMNETDKQVLLDDPELESELP